MIFAYHLTIKAFHSIHNFHARGNYKTKIISDKLALSKGW